MKIYSIPRGKLWPFIKKVIELIIIIIPITLFGQENPKTAHYPSIKKTGNDSIDNSNMTMAKYEWILNYPEEYRSIGGNPDEVINDLNKSKIKSAEVIFYSSPVDINDTSLYKLVSVDAVDVNNKHTNADMIVFKNEAREEIKRMNIIIDWKKQLWYYIPRNIEKEPRIKEFTVADNHILFTDCKECEDNKFAIITKTSRGLTMQIKPQDEWQYFVYQMEFKK